MYILIYLLNLFDLICTTYLVSKYGIEIEGNPIGRFIFTSADTIILFKVLIPAAALVQLWKYREHKLAQVALWLLLIVFILLTLYHLYIILKLRRNL